MTALWIILAMSAGVVAGFGLCAAMTVSREEQRKAVQPTLGVQPRESEPRF